MVKDTCWRCGKEISTEEHGKFGWFCTDCIDYLDANVYKFEFQVMQEICPAADEAKFLEMLCDYVELKCRQYDASKSRPTKEAIEEIRKRLEEELK